MRAKYAEIGPGSELPAEYPPQLQVGQKVVARHPVTRHLHDGDVLTVTPNSYRCQSLGCCTIPALLCPANGQNLTCFSME